MDRTARFRIGDCELRSLSDGFFGLDGGAMFGVIPRVLWQQTNPPDPNNRIRLALRPLLITTPKDRILVDTGVGRKYGDRFNRMFNVDDSDELTRSLGRQGLRPEEITVVVHTHLHFDHAGGTTELDHSGKPVPRFPNARHLVQADEWHDATHPNPRTQGSYRGEDYMPVAEAGLVERVEGDTDLGSGVTLVKTGGHTRGHQIVLVQGPDRTAVYWSDLIPTCSHVRIPYIMGYDLYPLKTMEQKERLVARAAAERWVCFFEHDPDTTAALIEADGDAFAVRPVSALGEG
ncbi:MAG: MBL fold metallo-hydrolase [candidate division WOR-3 bacterium]|nr:MAG: MBL fold metallo-hydrolase [candidate division WOR-3 bacterium]